LLLWSVDARAVLAVLADIHPGWFVLAMLLFVPQTVAIAWRWRLIAHPLARLSMRESLRQVLASNTLNLVLPSKLGDLAKGVFLHRRGACRLSEGMHIVVFEKLLDLAALCAWMVVGWVLLPRFAPWILAILGMGVLLIAVVLLVYFSRRGSAFIFSVMPGHVLRNPKLAKLREVLASGPRVMALVHADGGRRNLILGSSFLIWLLHLLQIACFFESVGADVTLLQVLAIMPIAIFAGLLPISLAGIGVRDWAIVALFLSPTNPAPLLAGVGLLVSLRYVVPASCGLPFVPRYFLASRGAMGSGRGRKATRGTVD
jgi:glycosyltransferase 2 family protein